MNTKRDIHNFVSQRVLAVVGISRAPRSFGTNAVQELKNKGYRLFLVNPSTDSIRGEKCYARVADIPEKIGGALFLTPPHATELAAREAIEAGVRRLWIQQGAQSDSATAFCNDFKDGGLSVVSGYCILMFAEPVTSFHRFHRFFKNLLGGLPS